MTSPLQNWPLPSGDDPPNGPTQMLALATAAEKQTVMTFSSATARDAKITSPVNGMVAYLTDIQKTTQYRGGLWRPLGIIDTYHHICDPSTTGGVANTQSASDTWTMTVPPLATNMTGTATFDVRIDFSAAAGGDVEFQLLYLGGTIATKTTSTLAASGHFYLGSTPLPFSNAVTPGAHTMIMRMINHSPGAAYFRSGQFQVTFK